jgi:hypothetical protein
VKKTILRKWLDVWGYNDSPSALHFNSHDLDSNHPYRSELRELLREDGDIRAHAVFDIEGIPTICFLSSDDSRVDDQTALDTIRQKIWNQNLVSIVLTVGKEQAKVFPVTRKNISPKVVRLSEARPFGEYSRADIQSGDVFSRHKDWFQPEARVDRELLQNLSVIVRNLEDLNVDRLSAQFLMAQILFISYLEHRQIVSDAYRKSRNTEKLSTLIHNVDKAGISKLLEKLKKDFNGDLLAPQDGSNEIWHALPVNAFRRIDNFLNRVDLETGQQDFWNYDFKFIPVELISGIYESFLSQEKRSIGAYYTPRNLANLVVTQAFDQSPDILSEIVYDGACGSGILLTTAYRRILSYAEKIEGRQLSFLKE